MSLERKHTTTNYAICLSNQSDMSVDNPDTVHRPFYISICILPTQDTTFRKQYNALELAVVLSHIVYTDEHPRKSFSMSILDS